MDNKINNLPHDQNYLIYDLSYETKFGVSMQQFTQMSLKAILKIIPIGKVIDIGCGTGRLTIPLAERNFQAIGVDLNAGMLKALKEKADRKNLKIPTFTDISQLEDQYCDLALTVFTVLSYILDEAGLVRLFQEIIRHLKPGGSYLFDLAIPSAFNQPNRKFSGNGLNGTVEVQFINPGGPIANYSESVIINNPDFPPNHLVTEFFQIRCWTLAEISHLLIASGFVGITQVNGLEGTGANYYVCKREG